MVFDGSLVEWIQHDVNNVILFENVLDFGVLLELSAFPSEMIIIVEVEECCFRKVLLQLDECLLWGQFDWLGQQLGVPHQNLNVFKLFRLGLLFNFRFIRLNHN